MARTSSSVRVIPVKLLELLGEAKTNALGEFDAKAAAHLLEVEQAGEKVIAAAAADLSVEENLDALVDTVRNYSYKRDTQYSRNYAEESRKRIESRYDSAIRLVEISSDEYHRVTSHTEFGYLLGL